MTLTEEAFNATLRKVVGHEEEARRRRAANISDAALMQGDVNATTIVCSLGYDPQSGVCRDYTMILLFMRAQQRNPSRNLAPFCYRAPERAGVVQRCAEVVQERKPNSKGGTFSERVGAWACVR